MDPPGRRLAPVSVGLGALLGAGLFALPRGVENLAGPAAPLSYLVAGVAVSALALGYAVFVSSPLGSRPGGAYLHLSRTWESRSMAFVLVWPTPAAYTALAAMLALWLGESLPLVGGDVGAVVVLFVLVAVHAAGRRVATAVQATLSLPLALLVVGLVAVGFSEVVLGNFDPLFPTPALRASPLSAVLRGAVVALFAFVGVEAMTSLAGDADGRTRGRNVLWVAGGVAVHATLASVVVLGVIPWARLIFAPVPFADAVGAALGVPGTTLALPGQVLAAGASLAAIVWAGGATLAGLGEVLPPLAVRRRGSPVVGVATVALAAAVLVLTDLVAVALFVAVAGLCLQYLSHAVSVAALPFVRPALFDRCALRPPVPVVVSAGAVGAVAAAAMGRLVVTLDPVDPLEFTRHSTAVTRSLEDGLVVDPGQTVLPALLGWTVFGVLVLVVARDYRAESGVALDPIAAVYERDPGSDDGDRIEESPAAGPDRPDS